LTHKCIEVDSYNLNKKFYVKQNVDVNDSTLMYEIMVYEI